MVLAIDIGNTNVVSADSGNQILFVNVSPRTRTPHPWSLPFPSKPFWRSIRSRRPRSKLHHLLCSPLHQPRCAQGGRKDRTLSGASGGAGVKTGLQIAIDNPAQLGSDRGRRCGGTSRIPAAYCYH